MKQELFAAKPLTRVLGAVIDGLDLSQTADSDVTDQLQSALLEYQVLFFEDQSLTVEQFEALSGISGISIVIHSSPRSKAARQLST